MDHKQFRKLLSERTGANANDIDALTEALSAVMRRAFTDLDAVAIPAFGTFTPVKHDEEISTDLSTGNRMLLPPEIRLEFTPGANLLRRLGDVDEVIPSK